VAFLPHIEKRRLRVGWPGAPRRAESGSMRQAGKLEMTGESRMEFQGSDWWDRAGRPGAGPGHGGAGEGSGGVGYIKLTSAVGLSLKPFLS